MSLSQKKVLVVGSGVIGLRTALELARRKFRVVLRAPEHPVQNSCSVVAGGFWYPFHCDHVLVNRWALQTLDELLFLAKQQQQDDLVEILPAIKLFRQNYDKEYPDWTQDPRIGFHNWTVEEMMSSSNETRVHEMRIPSLQQLREAGYSHAWFFRSPVANTPKMLQYYLDRLLEEGGAALDVQVETGRYYQSLSELQEVARDYDCAAVVNCTGMGSRSLVPDPTLIPARGVLLHFDRPERTPRDVILTVEKEPWGGETDPAYVIPRGSVVVVGGTYLEGDEETMVRPEERQKIFKNAQLFGINVDQLQGEKVGFRPYRSPVRCEFDSNFLSHNNNVPIFHSYGFGGSGWTVFAGAAKECVNQIIQHL